MELNTLDNHIFLTPTTNPVFDCPGDASGHSDMSDLIIFAFSHNLPYEDDPQVCDKLVPDIAIRCWHAGFQDCNVPASQYTVDFLKKCQDKNIIFMGGLTGSIVFREDAGSEAEFLDWITRNAWNEPVDHPETGVEGCYRGSLANPWYREHLLTTIERQIDLGVDGIAVDEANGCGYNGGSRQLFVFNEGFDDYFIADFNRYLMEKYPDFTESDWMETFMMSADNIIRPDVAYNDLQHNFNYRNYLQQHGWADYPHAPANPLAREWGKPVGNRVNLRDENFMEKALRLYWKDIVLSIRSYARQKHGREILITANGVYPYVDFNSLGLYNHNFDNDGKEADYMPVTKTGHLNGAKSLIPIFRKMLTRHHEAAGKVPLVTFIDFPTETMYLYYAFSTAEKKSFWQIYMPEAYACGLYYAFHLRTCIPSEPTAEQSGVLDFMIEYSVFYRKNRNLYQDVQNTGKRIKISIKKIAYKVSDQPAKQRRLIHLINHNYSGKIFPQFSFTVSFVSNRDPSSVFCLSPDFPETRHVAFSRSGNLIVLAVESLTYYDVLVVNW